MMDMAGRVGLAILKALVELEDEKIDQDSINDILFKIRFWLPPEDPDVMASIKAATSKDEKTRASLSTGNAFAKDLSSAILEMQVLIGVHGSLLSELMEASVQHMADELLGKKMFGDKGLGIKFPELSQKLDALQQAPGDLAKDHQGLVEEANVLLSSAKVTLACQSGPLPQCQCVN